MKVRCIELRNWCGEPEEQSTALKVGRVYVVLSLLVESNRLAVQLVSEEQGPAIFDMRLFEIVSSAIPPNWIVVAHAKGVLDFTPASWARPGFWEEYFDGKPKAVACFEEEKKKIIECDP